jgi:hypothetical protein
MWNRSRSRSLSSRAISVPSVAQIRQSFRWLRFALENEPEESIANFHRREPEIPP